jgi:xylulokinase
MIKLNDTNSRILACDFGTGGLTIGLYNPHANEMEAFGEAEYGHMSGLADERWLEQDPRVWIEAIPAAMDKIRSAVDMSSLEVVGIGVGGHMHALVVLDENDQPLEVDGKLATGAIMWNDPRGESEGVALSELFGEPIAARMTASRIRWFAETHPQVWQEGVARVCVPSTYVVLEATGAFGVGPGDGSGMFGQLDSSGQVAVEKLQAIAPDLENRVPKVGPAGEVCGTLNARGAELFGLAEGVPVAYPEGDQPVGMVASGVASAGQASISLGNSVVFNAVGAAPILDQRGVIDSFRTATTDHLLMTCVTSGCIVYDELVDCFSPLWKGTKDELRDWLADEAAKLPPGAGGVLALPFYLGEGVFRQPNATAAFLGLRRGQLNAGTLTRASMEANSLMMRYGYNSMQLGELKELVLSGGGSNNKLWPQIIADVFGVPVKKPQDAHEAATRGAAYLALFMVEQTEGGTRSLADLLAERVQLADTIEPNLEHTAAYQEILTRFEKAVETLSPLSA